MFFDEPQEAALMYRNTKENSDKVYLVHLVPAGRRDYWNVVSYWGPAGASGPNQHTLKKMAGRYAAERAFQILVESKIRKGYISVPRDFLPREYPTMKNTMDRYR